MSCTTTSRLLPCALFSGLLICPVTIVAQELDRSFGVSADGLGNVYISGFTTGSLGGPTAGGFDAFVSKFDAAGNFQWTRQLGTNTDEQSFGVSADGLGNVYISGYSYGSLGAPNAGGQDAFVSKFDAAGNLQWTRQQGNPTNDVSSSVSADVLGNVYISGATNANVLAANVFVSKYDAAGSLQWTRQQNSGGDDISLGVSADGLGNVYITGETNGSLGGPSAGGYDAFVSKYDTAGNLQWSRQLGTADADDGFGVAADGSGNVYISGLTAGSLGGPNAGTIDAFVSKFDASGNFQWTRQLGTAAVDISYGVSADGLGNVYISGYSYGGLGGANQGGSDAFVSKYNAAGNLQWT